MSANECKICNSLGKQIISYGDKNCSAELNFSANILNEISYDSVEKKFYLKSIWYGCPKYDSACVDKNGLDEKIEISFCPVCGTKLSTNSLSRKYKVNSLSRK